MLDYEQYTEGQVEAVLVQCGIDIIHDTMTHFICLCPFHGNRFTPSFEVNKTSGLYLCFNPACDVRGPLVALVKAIRKVNDFQAMRLILEHKKAQVGDFAEQLSAALTVPEDFTEFPQQPIDRMYEQFWKTPRAIEYMTGRGFERSTLREFQIGYSEKRDMIIVPMHDPNGMPIGFIGRSIEGKTFKNTTKLPKNKTLFNLHRAKRHGTAVVVEASFDVMRVHQAGYPGAVGLIGGSLSQHHVAQLDRHFDTIINMTDYDLKDTHMYEGCRKCKKLGFNSCQGHNPGREIGHNVIAKLPHKKVLWAAHSEGIVYPDGGKDPGDITDQQIAQCIQNAVTPFEYSTWGLD